LSLWEGLQSGRGALWPRCGTPSSPRSGPFSCGICGVCGPQEVLIRVECVCLPSLPLSLHGDKRFIALLVAIVYVPLFLSQSDRGLRCFDTELELLLPPNAALRLPHCKIPSPHTLRVRNQYLCCFCKCTSASSLCLSWAEPSSLSFSHSPA